MDTHRTGQQPGDNRKRQPGAGSKTIAGRDAAPPPGSGFFQPRKPFEDEVESPEAAPLQKDMLHNAEYETGDLDETAQAVLREAERQANVVDDDDEGDRRSGYDRRTKPRTNDRRKTNRQARPWQFRPTTGQAPQQQPAPEYAPAPRREQKRPMASLRRPPRVDPEEEARRRKARPYDWGKTAKFSQDQKKFLERIFKQFADYITTKLAPLLQARLTIEFQNIKLRPYSNFIQSIYEPTTIIITRIDPEFKGLITVDFPLSFAFIDRCLGGKGEALEDIRYFTEIETAVLSRICTRLIESYEEAWSEIKESKPQFLEMQFNPQTVHIAKPSDMMVCAAFDVRLFQAQGPVYVALPYDFLKSILPKANFEEFMLTRTSQAQATPSVAPLFAKNLERARIPVSVELGTTELLFRELALLEVGDCIKLDQEISKPLKIKVNEKVKFLGRPGVRDTKIAVQLSNVLQEGDEEFEE